MEKDLDIFESIDEDLWLLLNRMDSRASWAEELNRTRNTLINWEREIIESPDALKIIQSMYWLGRKKGQHRLNPYQKFLLLVISTLKSRYNYDNKQAAIWMGQKGILGKPRIHGELSRQYAIEKLKLAI